MQSIKFPLKFVFRISTLANDFRVLDADENVIAYVRSKLFKWKEDIQIFDNEKKTNLLYTIKADKWLDWSASYHFKYADGTSLGRVARKGMRSLWKAEYNIIDQNDNVQFKIKEDNGWVKVIDSIIGEIPIISMFTGYLFNPSYTVRNKGGEEFLKLKKEPSFFGRKFSVEKVNENMDMDDQERLMLSLMMMILLERRRG